MIYKRVCSNIGARKCYLDEEDEVSCSTNNIYSLVMRTQAHLFWHRSEKLQNRQNKQDVTKYLQTLFVSVPLLGL